MTSPTISLLYLVYNDSSGQDRLTIKREANLEVRHDTNVLLFSANLSDVVNMWRNVLLNVYSIGGAADSSANSNLNAVNIINTGTGTIKGKNIYYRIIKMCR